MCGRCLAANNLVYVEFKRDATVRDGPADTWKWEPFAYADGEKRFALPLQWASGVPIGVLTVECSTFTAMDERMIVLLYTVGAVMTSAVIQVEEMQLGAAREPLSCAAEVMKAYEVRAPDSLSLREQAFC